MFYGSDLAGCEFSLFSSETILYSLFFVTEFYMGFFKFERLDVWKRSTDWANQIFDLAQELPKEVQFPLGEQLRHA